MQYKLVINGQIEKPESLELLQDILNEVEAEINDDKTDVMNPHSRKKEKLNTGKRVNVAQQDHRQRRGNNNNRRNGRGGYKHQGNRGRGNGRGNYRNNDNSRGNGRKDYDKNRNNNKRDNQGNSRGRGNNGFRGSRGGRIKRRNGRSNYRNYGNRGKTSFRGNFKFRGQGTFRGTQYFRNTRSKRRGQRGRQYRNKGNRENRNRNDDRYRDSRRTTQNVMVAKESKTGIEANQFNKNDCRKCGMLGHYARDCSKMEMTKKIEFQEKARDERERLYGDVNAIAQGDTQRYINETIRVVNNSQLTNRTVYNDNSNNNNNNNENNQRIENNGKESNSNILASIARSTRPRMSRSMRS